LLYDRRSTTLDIITGTAPGTCDERTRNVPNLGAFMNNAEKLFVPRMSVDVAAHYQWSNTVSVAFVTDTSRFR